MVGIFASNKGSSLKLMKSYMPVEFSEGVNYNEKEYVKGSDFTNEFLDHDEAPDDTVFSLYSGVARDSDRESFVSNNLSANLLLIAPVFIGREFVKTSSLVANSDEGYKEVLIEILDGEASIIIESLRSEEKQIKLVRASKGDRVLIPKEYAFVVINSSSTEMFAAILYSSLMVSFKKKVLERNSGATLYKTKTGFVRNKNSDSYYSLEEFEGDYVGESSFEKEKTIYEQILETPDKFSFLNE